MQGRVSWLFRRLRATIELQQIISTSTTAPRVISSQKFCILNKSCTMQPLLYGVCISNKMVNGNRESTIKTHTSKIEEMTSYHIGRQTKNNPKVSNVFKNYAFTIMLIIISTPHHTHLLSLH